MFSPFTSFSPSAVPTYTISANQVGWFDASAVADIHADLLSWNFGDGNELYPNPLHQVDPVKYPALTVGANSSLSGVVTAHWFELAGTYNGLLTATSKATGAGRHYPFKVVVTKDTRPVLVLDNGGPADAAALATAAEKGNVLIRLATGWAAILTGTVLPGPNVGIFGLRSCVLTPAPGCPCFAGIGNGSTANLMLNGFSVSDPTSSGMIAHAQGSAWSLIDLAYDKLDRGVWANNIAGLLMQGCVQTDPAGTVSQGLYIDSATHACVTFCTFNGSVDESPVRFTNISQGVGGLNKAAIESCWIAQPAEAKAAFTGRAGSQILVKGCVGYKANLAANVGEGNPADSIGTTRVTDIVFDTCIVDSAGVPNVGFLIQAGVINAEMRNWDARVYENNYGLTVQMNPTDPSTLTGLLIGPGSVSGTGAKAYQVLGAPPTAQPANGQPEVPVWGTAPGPIVVNEK